MNHGTEVLAEPSPFPQYVMVVFVTVPYLNLHIIPIVRHLTPNKQKDVKYQV